MCDNAEELSYIVCAFRQKRMGIYRVSGQWGVVMNRTRNRIIAIAVIILAVIGIVFCSRYFSQCSRNTRELEKVLTEDIKEGTEKAKGKVSDLLKLDYDNLFVFGPYQSKEGMVEQMGFSSSILRESVNESMLNYIFVKDKKAVAYFYGYPSELGYCINLGTGQYSKEQVDSMQYEMVSRDVGNSIGEEKKFNDYNFFMEQQIEPVIENVVVQTNNVLISIPVGEEIAMDLDGTGVSNIKYSVEQSEDLTHEISEFSIDGTDYTDKLKSLGVAMDNPVSTNYYIVDLAEDDGCNEIALLDNRNSGIPETHFFRYRNNNLLYLGSVSDFPESGTCHFQNQGDRQGEIVASFPLDILQTWFADGYWILNKNNKLEFQPQSVYYPYISKEYESENPVRLTCNLMVHKEMDKESVAVELEPGNVSFIATDNKNWVQVEHADGNQGWFYLTEEDEIEVDAQGTLVSKDIVFENLNY